MTFYDTLVKTEKIFSITVSNYRKLTTKQHQFLARISLAVMHAYMAGNQSGAERDNGLLFGEQQMLLFSKTKMAP